MCGIVGNVDFNTNSSINLELLINQSNTIIHRGPDSGGTWISEDLVCGFAFRRLAIIDLSENGSQPMTTPDERYTIVFNGEIYNHAEIRTKLIDKGYTYHSQTDTETILYGYIEYGKEILNMMNGMWAIAIWDSHKQELFAARDRVGVKPFYYYYKDDLFVFGSEIKSILKHPKISPNLNDEMLSIYLSFGTSSNYSTLFKDIHKLTSGNYLTLNKESKSLNIREYWNPLLNFNKNGNRYLDISFDEAKERTLSLLKDAVNIRMMSDVPFGVFLSGGIDSSINVALMSELMNRPVDTFTVGFKELEKYNELEYARQISKQFNTNHKEILIDNNDAFSIIEELPYFEDEPNADPVCIPLYFLSKLTRESGTTVIQVGEGSDEQFVGYRWMLQGYDFQNTYWKYYNSLPKFGKKLIYNSSKGIFKSKNQYLALEYLRRASYDEQFNWSGVPIFGYAEQEELLLENKTLYLEKLKTYGSFLNNNAEKANPKIDYLQRIIYLEQKQRLAELLLMRVDKITMQHSLEARVPFLDYRMLEFTTSLKESNKIKKGVSKVLLKEAVKGILPDNIINRKKQGFAAPVDNWFALDLNQYAKNEILNGYFVKNNFLNKNHIENLFERAKNPSNKLGNSIYALLNLNLWHKKFFK